MAHAELEINSSEASVLRVAPQPGPCSPGGAITKPIKNHGPPVMNRSAWPRSTPQISDVYDLSKPCTHTPRKVWNAEGCELRAAVTTHPRKTVLNTSKLKLHRVIDQKYIIKFAKPFSTFEQVTHMIGILETNKSHCPQQISHTQTNALIL